MPRLRSLFHILTHIAILGFFTSPVFAATFTAYGPETFQRGSGAPITVTRSFTVFNPNTTYTLKIYNGGLEDGDYEKVSSTVIGLNGTQIVGPSEFNQTVSLVEKPVTLSITNELSVEVRGKPGGGITILIIGVDNDPPTITASVSPSPNAAGWHNQNVTVTFTCTDATSGIATCTTPVTLSAEGSNQLVSGTATDLAGNSATTHAAVNIDKTSPIINITSPQPDAVLNVSKPGISVEFSDGLSGVDTATVNLSLDGLGVTSDSLITASGLTYTPTTALQDGTHSIVVSASDKANNTGTSSILFTTKTRTRPFLFPEPGFDAGSYDGVTNIFNGPMKVGDINRDGVPDVVVLNHIIGASKISVILGKGDGGFQNPITFGERSGSYDSGYDDIAVDDFNGDGSLDLALTVFLSNKQYELLLFTGNGDGTFTTGTSYTLNAPGKILTGKFDADPYEDIAIAAQNGRVSLFRGNGNGSISNPTTAWSDTAGSWIKEAVAADFNRDGRTDIGVVAGDSSYGREFLMLLNNGDGTFQSSTVIPWDDSFYISNLTFGDLNGDGCADLLILRDGSFNLRPDVLILLNDGNGNFQVSRVYQPWLVIPSGNFSIFGGRMARLSDLNGDQKLDLLISSLGTVFTFLGNGDGTFQPPSEWSVSGGSLNTGDFDQDGAQDLVTVAEHHIFILFGRGDGDFIDREEIPTSSGNYDLLSADLDGDRTPDLAIPVFNSGALFSTILNRGNTWAENNLSPPFEANRTYRAGIKPVVVKMEDLNKDGHPDFVVANALSNDVSVLLNTGNGDLNAAVSYPVGSAPVFMALEDLNRDGDPDIVTANSGSNDISILLGRGDGGFQARKIYAAGPNPKSLAIADINGDGRPDVVVADNDFYVNYVSILLGNGDGTFQPYTRWTTGGWSPVSIQKGDFNGDGHADFAVANYTRFPGGGISQSLVTLLLGKGDGTFDERIVYRPGGVYFLNELLSEDLNQDGKPDLIAIDYHADSAWVFLTDGYGQFNPIQTLYGLDGSSVTLGDLNQDGTIDLLAGGLSSLHLWLGRGDGTFLSDPSIGGWEDVASIQIGDMDGDGVSDIVLVDGNNLSVIPGEGGGIFPGDRVIPEVKFSDHVFSIVDSVASADFNGDHNQDIVLVENPYDSKTGTSGGYYPRAVIYWGAGDNTFRRGPTLQTNTLSNRGVLAADFNEDGLVDVALSQDKEVLIGINNGDGTFKPPASYRTGSTVAGKLLTADTNHDGHLDLIRTEGVPIPNQFGAFSYSISIHTGNGDGTFQPNGTILLDPLKPSDVVVQDSNGDGYPDLAVSMFLGNTLRIYLNNGSGTFNSPITYEVGIEQGTLIAQDFNQDGFMDLVIGDQVAINLLLGKGDGTFQPPAAYGLGEIGSLGPGGMISRDFNLDGLMDIAASPGHSFVNNVKLLLNLLPPLRTPPSPPKNLAGVAGDGRVSLAWAASPEADIAGYDLYRSSSSGGGYTRINTAPITSLSYIDTSVTNGQLYFYAVAAVDAQGEESSFSRKVKLTPHPADTAPPIIKITTPVNGGVTVNPLLFVSGTIDDADAKVTVNGVSAAVQTHSGTFTAYNIPLNLGLNTITVRAVDSAGNRSSDTVTVTYALVAGMTGTVQDARTGDPISEATVSIQDFDGTQTVTTGSNGLYAFARLVPGEVTLTVNPPSYYRYYYDVSTIVQTLSPGQTLTLNILLDLLPATLTGTVYDLRTYAPIAGATVTVTDRKKTQSVITDGNGRYWAENITPYEITITVEKTGYETKLRHQSINPGQLQVYDFYLNKLPPSAPTGLVATPVVRGMKLTWNANTESDLLGYNVYRATTSGGPYARLTASPVTSPSFRDAGLDGETTYYYVVTAVNTSRSESGYSAEASATTPTPTIPVTITSPADGANVSSSSVIVTGTIDAALTEIGVVIEVNGPNGIGSVPAHVNRNAFSAVVPLQAGADTLTAVAFDPTGAYGEASITINATIPQQEIRLSANPSSGVADVATGALAVTLQVEMTLTNPVSQYRWDYEGNGTIDQTGSGLTQITVQYQAVGIYYPTVIVIDTMGNTHTATTVVNVLSRDELDALLKSKWEEMKTALIAGDIEGALSYYLENSRERYRGIFSALGAHLQEVITSMQPIEFIYMKNGLAKYRIRRAEDAGLITYYIHFQMDDNGVWQIEQF